MYEKRSRTQARVRLRVSEGVQDLSIPTRTKQPLISSFYLLSIKVL